jgi:cell division protein ZipA
MTELRWILLVVGLVVIAAIYIMDRRNRRTSASDATQTRAESFVPQLDQPARSQPARPHLVAPKSRAAESSLAANNDDGMDDLPPMHADMDVMVDAVPVGTESPHITSSGMSTGAFIAAQAQVQRSEPIALAFAESVVSPAPATMVASPVPAPTPTPTVSRATKKPASRKIVALRLSAGNERVDGARLKSLLEAAGLRHGKYSIYHRLHNDDAPLFSVASMVEPGTFDPHGMTGMQFPGVTLFMQLPGPIDGSEMFSQMIACARELEQGIGGLLQDERGLPLTEQRAQRLREDVADFLHLLGQS